MSDLEKSFAIARGLLSLLEERLSDGTADPAETQTTLTKVVGALASHGRPTRSGKKPPRGYGYTFDEAQIIASLPWHRNNLSAAIRAQFPKADKGEVDNHADRIRGRRAEIAEAIGDDHPWESAGNWLGDLIAE